MLESVSGGVRSARVVWVRMRVPPVVMAILIVQVIMVVLDHHLQLAPARAPASAVRRAVLPPQLDPLAHQAEAPRLALLREVRTPAVPAHAACPHLGHHVDGKCVYVYNKK